MALKKSRPTETVTLEFPIEVDGVSVDSLTVRRPTVRDQLLMDKMKGSETEKGVKYIANLCEVAPSDIEQLDAADFLALSEVVQGFVGPQRET